MGEEGLGLPLGFRFHPTDLELVESYLKPHILGRPTSRFVIRERQIYGDNANPWDVFAPEFSAGKFMTEGGVYVFVRLQRKKKKSFNHRNNDDEEEEDFGKNFVRVAGCGTWDGQTQKPIMVDGRKIGVKRSLVFEMFDSDDNRTRLLLDPPRYWTIHEYSVPEGFPNPHDLVLCFVSVDYSKCPKIKRSVKGRRVLDSQKKKKGDDDDGLDMKTKKRKSRVVDDNVGATGVDVHDGEEALGLTSLCYGDKEANNRLEMVQVQQKRIRVVNDNVGATGVVVHDDEEALGLM